MRARPRIAFIRTSLCDEVMEGREANVVRLDSMFSSPLPKGTLSSLQGRKFGLTDDKNIH